MWKPAKKVAPVTSALNDVLPISNDIDLLAGGIPYEAMPHEMLMWHKKTLAAAKYCQMAANLTTPGCFSVFLLLGVPIAFAGKVTEKLSMLKS